MFYGKKINYNEIFPLTREIFDQLIHSSELGGLDSEIDLLYRSAKEYPDKWTDDVVKQRIYDNKRKRPYICTSDFITSEECGVRSEELNASPDKKRYRRLNKYARWSGYCSLDIDHIGSEECRGKSEESVTPISLYESRIKGHEEEWGIVCAFRSPSQHGLKIIFRIAKDVAIADAQRSLAQLIGCDYDSSTKDAARATFLVSHENFFYISDSFLREKTPQDQREKTPQAPHMGGCGSPQGAKLPTGQIDNGKAKKTERHTTGQIDSGKAKKTERHTSSQSDEPKPPVRGVGGSVRWKCKRPTRRVMMILEVAMRSRSITKASLKINGQRHTQLLNLLSTQVGRLLPKEEFMGGYKKLCPQYAKEDEAWQLVKDYYDNYLSEDKPLSATFANTFRQVLNIDDEGKPLDASLSEECGVWSEELNDSSSAPTTSKTNNSSLHTPHSSLEKDSSIKNDDWHPFSNIEYPAALAATLDLYPDKFKLPVLCSLLPLLGAYADGVRVRYIDNHQEPLALMTVVVGEMASGKSNCKRAVDLWRTPMEIADNAARKIEEEWRQERKGRKANEKAKPDPEVFIKEVPITTSCSALLRRMKLANGRCVFSFGEELDTLRKTNSAGNWSAKYDIYRMAFDNAVWGQDYNSDMAESGMVKVFYNWAILGTYGSFEKCFRADSVENGLGSRILVVEMPDNAFEKITAYELPTPETKDLINEAAEKLMSQQGSIALPALGEHAATWLEDRRLEALRNVDYVMDTFRKRASVIAYRAATIFHLLERGVEAADASDHCVRFYEAMADYVLRKQMSLFGSKLSDGQLPSRSDYGTCNAAMLDRLPKQFTREDVYALRKGKATMKSIYSIVRRWKENSLIREVGKNKFEVVSVHKNSD